MSHHTPLISTIVIGLVLAFGLGVLAQRIKISPIVGYLLAGVVMGPFTPGYVGDQNIANQLAEIGVILLMFGVGLHFSLDDLLSVRGIAIPGAVVQIATATILGMAWLTCLAGAWAAGLSSGLPCRWRARWCCCAPCRKDGCSKRIAAGSQWAG